MKSLLIAGFAAFFLMAFCGVQGAQVPSEPAPQERLLLNVDKKGVAIAGYDPVSYYSEGGPVKGQPRHSSNFRRAKYYFASAEHKAMFDADPVHYAPAYGGYCGYAASINRISAINPLFYGIEDGRLILQNGPKALELFERGKAENIQKADRNWPLIEAKNGATEGKTLILTKSGVGAHGWDLISYQNDAPTKGMKEEYSSYHGVVYRFATMKNRFQFEDDPQSFLPEAGGYCAYAAALGKKARSNPEFYSVVDGHLCLFGSKKAKALFDADSRAFLAQARENYPGLVERYGK